MHIALKIIILVLSIIILSFVVTLILGLMVSFPEIMMGSFGPVLLFNWNLYPFGLVLAILISVIGYIFLSRANIYDVKAFGIKVLIWLIISTGLSFLATWFITFIIAEVTSPGYSAPVTSQLYWQFFPLGLIGSMIVVGMTWYLITE